ncbi:hypothetical protein [Alteromonas abrolhosensis]|uniref:hypothetical protein n=1 Tax=Alteromonas abrolhosensis TaxID=1892904 RepID=UPI00096BA20F|nr:hypothetical protein [Alteromonas abrolhosensis]
MSDFYHEIQKNIKEEFSTNVGRFDFTSGNLLLELNSNKLVDTVQLNFDNNKGALNPELFEVLGVSEDKTLYKFKLNSSAENDYTYASSKDVAVHKLLIKSKVLRWHAWQAYYPEICLLRKNELVEHIVCSDFVLNLKRNIDSHVLRNNLNEQEAENLRLIIDSGLFKTDWTNQEIKSIELFNSVADVMSPYCIGSHGITIPLKSLDNDLLISRLEQITSYLNSLGRPWFCTSGTLLGLAREGELIGFDDDLDFVAYLGEVNDIAELEGVVQDFYNANCSFLEQGMNALQFKMKGNVGAVDVFLSWSIGGKVWIYPWCGGELEYDNVFPVAQKSFYSQKLCFPNNIDMCLSLNYGNQWIKPDPLWRFNWDKSNIIFKDYLLSIRL